MAGEPRWKTGLSQKQVQAARRRRRDKEMREAYEIVDRRSGGICEVEGCGRQAGPHHHILGRRRADSHLPEHIIHVCDPHHREIHDNPDWARAEGYMGSRLT